MKTEISGFLGYIGTERGLSPKTVEAYSHDLGKFSEFVVKELGDEGDVGSVDQYFIRLYLQSLADKGNAAVSRGRKLATLKSFFKYLMADGRVKVDPAVQVRMPRVTQKEPSYLTEQEYKRLLRTVQRTATRFFRSRDTAIVTMLLGMGLRLSELVGLNIGDINFEDASVKVTRKGRNERILPANEEVLMGLRRYLNTRKEATGQDPLFLSKRNQRIDNASVWHLVRKYLQQAQIEKDRLSPHTLRHTFATMLLKQGENILTIKELLSHRNLRTTERYLHICGEDLRVAVSRLGVSLCVTSEVLHR
jgi:site-specific recombinase XerD